MKITAAVVTNPFKVRLQEVEAQDPGAGDVVIRTDYSFISNGTESHVQRGTFPDKPLPFPYVTGYEAVGRITHVGGQVAGLKVGDRVFATTNRVGSVTQVLGGAHAQTIITEAAAVLKVPDDADPTEVAALVVAQVGYNGGSRLARNGRMNVLVVGDGLIGQFAAQAALSRGHAVLLAGHHDERLRRAKDAFPEMHVINSRREDLDEALNTLFGKRLEAALDSIGAPSTLTLCMERLVHLGHLIVLGWQGGEQSVSVHAGFGKEATVHFPAGWTRERLEATLELIRTGRMKVKPLITHRFKAADVAKAFEVLEGDRAGCLGIVIDWTAAPAQRACR